MGTPSVETAQPMFGRERELSEFRATLEAAEAGKGALVLLVGEPGIGKTRLANQFATEAAQRGARITWGRAWEAGGAPAYWPWTEAMHPFAELVTAASEAERARIAPLAHLMPELSELQPPPPVADPAQNRFRLFEAVAAFLALVARERPLVILLDDMHVADVGSLSLLHFIARKMHASRVVVVATYRDVEARLSAEASDAITKITREGRYLALRRLVRDEVARWAAAEGVVVGDAESLFALTEGNPLFVGEMLRLARDAGPASMSPGRLPAGVRDVIRARLALLSPAARGLLEVSSVLGRTLDLGLAAALADTELAIARDLAAEAVGADLLVAASDRTSFSHILIREVLYQDLAAARRAELHLRVGRALLERHGADPDASIAEAVHHLFAAVPLADVDEAIRWARQGAERAKRHLAYEEAIELLARAAAALPAGRDVDKCDLLLELAGARIGAGQATAGRELAVAAATIARRLDDAERLARAALCYGSVFVIAQVDRVLIGLLEESLAGLPAEDSPLRAQLLARLGAAFQPAPDPEPPMRLAREGIAMARRVADEPTRLAVLISGTSALSYFDDPAQRLPLDTELAALATRLGDPFSVLRALLRLVFDHVELGDDANADKVIDEYDRLSRTLDLPAFRWRAPVMRSMRAIMDGRLDESEALCADAAAIAARGEDAVAPMTLAFHRAARLSVADRLDELAAHLPVALDLVTRLADPIFARCFRTGMLARLGRADEAKDDLAFLLQHEPPLRARPMLVWAADACLARGDREAAATIAELLRPVANRRHFWTPGGMVVEKRTVGSVVAKLVELAPASIPVAPRPLGETFSLVNEGEYWTIRADTTFRLRDSRGLSILAKLVENRGTEIHVADLVAPGGEQGHVEDAGDVLDARAIASYKRRLEDLREAEDEATRHNDRHRASRIREEIDALAGEVSRAVGLGGRARKAASSAEKARINVRKRLLDMITRIREHSPALAKHLERSIRTGMFCSYDP